MVFSFFNKTPISIRMGHFIFKSHFSKVLRGIFVFSMFILFSACMPKVEEGSDVDDITITSHDIERSGSNAKVILHGTCPTTTDSYRVNVEEVGWDVYSPLITALVEGSGQPIGTCTAGVLNIQYPVPRPSEGRTISFRVKAKLSDGKLSLYPALRDVLYELPTVGVPGFMVAAGGAFETTGAVTVHASIGIAHAYVPTASTGTLLVPGSSASLRAGLQGLLYDDSF